MVYFPFLGGLDNMNGLDLAVNEFVIKAGGVDFIATLFSIPVVFAIFYAIIKPFDI